MSVSRSLAFATLEPGMRTDATSLFSLMRNLGSSVGISMVSTLLAQNTQVNHASLAEHVTPMSRALDGVPIAQLGEVATSALAYLDAEVTRQAAMIAYLDDFRLMMVVTLAAAPLLLLLRRRVISDRGNHDVRRFLLKELEREGPRP